MREDEGDIDGSLEKAFAGGVCHASRLQRPVLSTVHEAAAASMLTSAPGAGASDVINDTNQLSDKKGPLFGREIAMQTQVLAVVLALLAAAHGENFKKYDAAAVKRFSDELSRRGIVPPSLSRPQEPQPASRPDPAASAPAGDFEGRWTRSHFGRPIAAFEGIPYAQPPVGDLRFKVAKPLANRLADFKANKPGAMCVQHDMFGTKKLIGSEDCLFINVYVPEKVQRANGEKLPVMFFVHGGGYIFGQGDFYQSNVLLDKDVVLVTMNYRLGVLGFMTTEDDVIPANLGLKDQVAALRWVHDNIASFGGDPNLVTVFGHSAGSSSSQFLMLSPLTQGLMHRVIAMSGSVFAPWALSRPGKMAEARRSKAEQLGCPPEPSRDFLACLQTKTAEEIYRQESVEMTISFMPVVEGDVPGAHIPHHPKKMLSDGPLNDVPYMTGVTSEEGLMFTAGMNDSVIQGIEQNFAPQTTAMLFLAPEDEEKVESLRKAYISPGPMSRANLVEYSHIFGDLLFVWPALKADFYRRKGAKSPTYFYYFNYQSPNLSFLEAGGIDLSKGNYYGVSHGDDLFYLFNMPMETKTTPPDVLMSMIMTDIYTSFARDGVPSSPLLRTNWQPVKSGGDDIEYLHFRYPLDITMQKDLLPERWYLLRDVFDSKSEHDEL